MENIPLHLPIVFIATAAVTLLLLYKASQKHRVLVLICLAWMGIQASLALTGFYLNTYTSPPRFALAVLPPVIVLAACFITPGGRKAINSFNTKWLTLLHVVRVPVEIVLYGLYLQKYVPELMTFTGRNPDILSGITAPLVFYFGYVQKKLGSTVLLAWNFVSLSLLVNIVAHAVLSAPGAFQQLAFDQPNVGVLYFPYIWLPCFIVPTALFSHLVCIRQLLRTKQAIDQSSPTVVATP